MQLQRNFTFMMRHEHTHKWCLQLLVPLKELQMATIDFDWKQTDAPFFPKVRAPPYTHASVRGFENTNQKIEQYYSSSMRRFWM